MVCTRGKKESRGGGIRARIGRNERKSFPDLDFRMDTTSLRM
jgi:hypothetical protein